MLRYNWLMFPEYSAELAMFLEKEITLPTFEMFWKAPLTTFLVATQVCMGAGVRLLGDSSTKSSFRIVLIQLQCPSIVIWIIIYPISLIIWYRTIFHWILEIECANLIFFLANSIRNFMKSTNNSFFFFRLSFSRNGYIISK